MKSNALLAALLVLGLLYGCGNNNANGPAASNSSAREPFDKLLQQYYEESLQVFPLNATANGDHRYDDRFPNDNSTSYRALEKSFFTKYLDSLKSYDTSKLSKGDLLSYKVLKYDLELQREALSYKAFNDMPINQIFSQTLVFPQLGSAESFQPFETVKDYENFLKRIDGFTVWCDTAISNMRTGMKQGYVLPKALVVKIIPQMKSFVDVRADKSVFYGPVRKFPKTFTDAQKSDLTNKYTIAITGQIIPSYRKLENFLSKEYLPAARNTSGIGALPGGDQLYKFALKSFTTTAISPDSVFNLGLKEVARIRTRMDSIRQATGFKGDLAAFLTYVRTDKKFTPFHSDKEILDEYQKIYATEKPRLPSYFGKLPKTRFEIRKTEDFRAASAAFGEYNQGTADGKRPGIFYTAILDPAKYSSITMETLFMHEAIPGHHFQISLQNENTSLPMFRRYYGNSAFVEGWALYAESLGNVLGEYKDPYELLGHLGDEIHRAIRLVVDAGMHSKGWTRERAIKYMLDNEPTSTHEAEAEIERYMAAPGQAVSYKVGALTIQALREKYRKSLGDKFRISDFHDAVLGSGALPLQIFIENMDSWAASVR